MSRTTAARLSSLIAVCCALAAWVGLRSVEVDANASLDDVSTAVDSVEQTLAGSSETALATADALDAAARALDTTATTSASTSEVASDVADIAGSLAPVVVSISSALGQVDDSITGINDILDRLPFGVGRIQTVDQEVLDTEALLASLSEAERSLDVLATDALAVGPETTELASELRRVAVELRSSSADLERLQADVADTLQSIGDDGQLVDLGVARLLVLGLATAMVVMNIPDLSIRRGIGSEPPA